MIDFIDHEKLDSEGFKKLKKPGEELFLDSMNSNAVKGVQTFLNKEGFRDGKGEPLTVDGVAGANTANAVMGYQRKKGLTVDGIVGDETWNSMYKDKKKSEAYFREARKNNGGDEIKTPITPKGPEMNPYKPKSERKDSHFSSNFDVWSGIGNPLKDHGKSDDESFHDRVRRIWGNGGKPSGVLSLSRDNTPGISTSPFSTYKSTGIAFDDYAFSKDESDFSRSNRRTDKLFATEEPELTLMSNPGSKESGGGYDDKTESKGFGFMDAIRYAAQMDIKKDKAKFDAEVAQYTAVAREAWKTGAEVFLKDCPVSKYMLEHSLQDNPTSMTLGNESDIAKLIVKDPVYLNALDKAIEESDGKTIDTNLEDIAFKTPDLYYSIHKAKIHVKGYKNGEGKWIITAMLEDTYDFTEIMTLMDDSGEWSARVSLGTVANDLGTFSQMSGVINPYMVRVYFNTIR